MNMYHCAKMDSNEDESDIVVEEVLVICQSTKPKIIKYAKIEEIILELHEKAKKILSEGSSLFRGEKNVTLMIGRWPYSNHFFTLCFLDVMKFKPLEKIIIFEDKPQNLYILPYVFSKGKNYFPHLKSKSGKSEV